MTSTPSQRAEAAGATTPQLSIPQSQPQERTPTDWTPVTYMEWGMFQGRWMSFSMAVAQQPAVGRRKTDKDRRALAPSPIIRLWIREHGPDGTGRGVLIDPGEVEIADMVCAAELLPPRGDVVRSRDTLHPGHESPRLSSGRRTPSPRGRHGPSHTRDVESGPPYYDPRIEASSSGEEDELATTLSTSRPQSRGSEISHGGSHRTPRVTHSEHIEEVPAPQPGQASGRNLYGSLHVSGIRVPAMEGGLGLWFLFTDLSVRQEGQYSLRFRCFDMTGISGQDPRPALVECRTMDFQVFTPRSFPGLPRPTELSEHFARQGYRLNTRRNERQAPSPAASPLSPPAASRRPPSSYDTTTSTR